MLTLSLCLFSLLLKTSVQQVITMAQGKMRGLQQDGFVSYVGVPYATVRAHGRFKNAGLAPTWVGIRKSRDPYCTSNSEPQDCLQLDVHVPSNGRHMPALAWVASGGDYRPDKLVKEGIIVVVIRHRLGLAGFMCSQEANIPGNVGVKDVILALRWVRDNIVAFNGNPHRVVLAGQGFGAAMVEAVCLTSMAEGLYHGVILQSGTALAPWAFNYDANVKTEHLLRAMNGTEVLLKSPISNIARKSQEMDVSYFPYGLCIEKPFRNEERLLSDAPYNILMKGKSTSVPMLIGYNTNEAYVFVSTLKEISMKKISRDATFLLPMELQARRGEVEMLGKQVFNMYFKENTTIYSLLDYYRDAYFVNHIHRSAKLHAASSPVFYYQFSHSGTIGVQPDATVKKTGAAHSDELGYLFPNEDMKLDEDDVPVFTHLVTLWANFVKNLNPNNEGVTFQWKPFEPQEPQLLDIQTQPEMIAFAHRRQMQMWDEIYEKYYYRRHM